MSLSPESLRVVRAFRGLDDHSLRALAGVLQRREWADGDPVLRQGNHADGVCFLLEGHVRVERRLPEGGTVGLATLGPGGLFGALAALDGGPRAADCVAWGRVLGAWLSQTDFDTLMNGSTPLSLRFQIAVLRTLFSDIRAANLRLAELATLPALEPGALQDVFGSLA